MKHKTYLFLTLLFIFFSTYVVGEIVNESNYTVKYDPVILEAFNNQTRVPVLVRLVDNSNITVTGSKDERRVLSSQRDEWFKPVLDEVLVTLSDDDIRDVSKHISEFRGEISEEGFYKLLNNSKVNEIIWDNIPLPEAATNENISVEYDSEILDAFDNNQTWVRVIVDLKDNSGINVTGTKEERTNLSRQIDEWFKPIVDDMYNMFSEDEFIIIRKSLRGLSGEISEKGFNKLINDVRVKYVYMDAVGSVAIDENNIGVEYNVTNENNHDSEKNGTKDNKVLIEPESKENLSSKKQITEEEPKSLFLRVIQFFKNLFGIK